MDTCGEIMFVAGIDCSSAQFWIDGAAEYVNEHRTELPEY
jgi:hypothetical protein